MRHSPILLALLSTATLAWAGDQSLLPHRAAQTGVSLVDLVAGDVDGDGREDLIAIAATAVANGFDVQLFRFGPYGDVIANPGTALTGKGAAGASADFNNDGLADVAVITDGSRVHVQLATLSGTLGTPASHAVAPLAQDLVPVDLDADGWIDLVVLQAAPATQWTRLHNLGNGTFSAASVQPAAPFAGNHLTAADLDVDGLLDLAVAAKAAVRVVKGQPGGGLELLASYNLGGLREIATLDMTGDGVTDIAVASGIDTVDLLPGVGGGSFGAPKGGIVPGDGEQLAVLDSDGDGDEDLLVGTPEKSLRLYPNTGLPVAFTTQLELRTSAVSPLVVAIDANGDGWRDIVTANPDAGRLTLISGSDEGLHAAGLEPLIADPRSLQAGDFTGDGHADLFSAGGTNGNILAIAEGHGNGTFGPVFTTTLTLPFDDQVVVATTIGSCDGDAQADVAVLTEGEGGPHVEVVRCVDFATLVSGGPVAIAANYAVAGPLAADIDGDGLMEVAVAATDDFVHVWRSAADGSLTSIGDTAVPGLGNLPSGELRFTVGDVNEDGLLDMLFPHLTLGAVVILPGEPGGTLGAPSTVPQALLGTWLDVAVPDLDQDGLLDLVISDHAQGLFVKRGVQGMAFGPMQNISESGVGSIAAADIDADGHVDVVGFSNIAVSIGSVVVHRGHADGHLDPARSYTLQGRFMAVADVSFDGIPDVIVQQGSSGSGLNGSVSVAVSQPGTNFEDEGHALAGVKGKPQLLAWGWLKPGQPVDLRLSKAAPLSPVVLVVGLSVVNLPFKSGTLVPAADLILPGFATDADGRLDFTVGWPSNVPAGQRIVLQAWIADAAGPSGFAASNGLQAITP